MPPCSDLSLSPVLLPSLLYLSSNSHGGHAAGRQPWRPSCPGDLCQHLKEQCLIWPSPVATLEDTGASPSVPICPMLHSMLAPGRDWCLLKAQCKIIPPTPLLGLMSGSILQFLL